MKIIASLLILLMASPVLAGDFYVLEMGDMDVTSEHGQETIGIKREMKSQYPRLKLREKTLLSVTMVAKTFAGRGKAKLIVNGASSSQQIVGGHAGIWKDINEKSFDRILFKNNMGSSRGPWKLGFDGAFKVRQLVVEIAENGQ